MATLFCSLKCFSIFFVSLTYVYFDINNINIVGLSFLLIYLICQIIKLKTRERSQWVTNLILRLLIPTLYALLIPKMMDLIFFLLFIWKKFGIIALSQFDNIKQYYFIQ